MVYSGVSTDLNAIDFMDSLQGWIVGNNSTMLKTSDGGLNWLIESDLPTSVYTNYYDIEMDPFRKAIVGSAGLYLALSYDIVTQKRYWDILNTGVTNNLNSIISVYGGRQLHVVGDEGIILYVYTWFRMTRIDLLSVPPSFDLEDIFYHDELMGWTVGRYGAIFKTYNKHDYELLNMLAVNKLNSVIFVDSLIGFTAGTEGSLFKSTDGGYNWQRINTRIKNEIKKIYFVDENTGWVIGDNGMILKTVNNSGDPSEVDNYDPQLFKSYVLYQNYPNPFNPSTTISFEVPFPQDVELTIYDILGREVAVLFSGVAQNGINEITFNAERLSSGIYFYLLKTAEFTDTKKLLIVK